MARHSGIAKRLLGAGLVAIVAAGGVPADLSASQQSGAATATPPPAAAPAVELPPEYVIGPEDVLSVNFWRDPDMSRDEVTVRPDGRITLPLVGDITAAGLTPEQLKAAVEAAASKLQQDPSVTVGVRQINSRKVFITGNVANPATYPLAGPRTVMQLLAMAGGLTEYANKKNIRVMRTENGRQTSYRFNYNDFSKGKNLAQNILLKPGDTVVVP